MFPHRTLFASLLLLLLPLGSIQGQETGLDPTEALATLGKTLKDCKKSDEEERAAAQDGVVAVLDQLLVDFPQYDEKQQKSVVSGVSKVFKVKTREGEDRIYIAAAVCLSEMGPKAESQLKSAMKVKQLQKKPDVQAVLIESLGKHRNLKNVDLFVKLLNDGDANICVAAVHALSEYRDTKAKDRKEIVEALVKQYANTNNLDLREKGKNPVWRERLLVIEVPMNEALASLTLQSFRTAPEWEKWYNDNRSKKW